MNNSLFNSTKQLYGRRLIKTSHEIIGDPARDVETIKKILDECLPIHAENAKEQNRLFDVFFNSADSWDKSKVQRDDINNKISVASAWAISRTLNFYCFGEPIKYISRDTSQEAGKQAMVENLSEMLDYQHNHDSTTMATLSSSICGLGYKLVLPSDEEEFNFSGVPFRINGNFIFPQTAFCVYSSEVIPQKVIGVYISTHYDDKKQPNGSQYTVWTKYHQYTFIKDLNNNYKVIPVKINNDYTFAYPIFSKRIPLVEVERNAFRKGDWEVVTDLISLKNMLISGRADDIQQVIDYMLVMINCSFANKEDKKDALNNRLFEIEQLDSKNAPSIQILKNALDQNAVQVYADYLDLLIQECVGIPNRGERSGGGHDTGKAVMYRNGFRDLENNAGLIIPKMDKAETEFIGICISYANTLNLLKGLKPYDVRNKFIRTLSDDPNSASTAYATFRRAGMNDIDSLIASKSVTDPSEVAKNNEVSLGNNGLLFQWEKI